MIEENSSTMHITNTKDQIAKKSSNEDDIEQSIKTSPSSLNSFPLTLKSFISPSIQLFQKNNEFRIISLLFSAWIIIAIFEFIYALTLSNTIIIGDGFFNTFKMISFLITCLSLLFTHLSSNDNTFIFKRIELIASLSSIIFLVIVSVYMCLQSLHFITEDHDIIPPVTFLQWLYIIKIILDIIALMTFSDYILHPSYQIKLFLWKICKEWKDLNGITYAQLKQSSKVLKGWNNHFENMNSLCVSLISDLISSVMFIILFYIFDDKYFDKAYMMISCINFICVIFMAKPLFMSVLKILMQGKCEVYEAFYSKVNKEITYFEGCLGVKDIKFWMYAPNDIRGYIKIYSKETLDRTKLKETIQKISDEIELNCDLTLEISE